MRVGQKCVYAVMRNGKPFKYFSTETTAFTYIAACLDLDPDSEWTVTAKEVMSA